MHHGDPIAFRHNATGKMLNSHNVAGPMTHTHQEVSCYGSGDEQAYVSISIMYEFHAHTRMNEHTRVYY